MKSGSELGEGKILKNSTKNIVLVTSLLTLAAGTASAQAETNRTKIESVLQTYETALNSSDTDKVLALYAPDGVFMPQHSPSAIGADAVRAAYDRVFHTIKLEVDFEIQEIVQVAPDWAFVRTNSSGFVTIMATGDRGPEANQELFIFHKDAQDNWKIARYCFSTTNPPRM